MSDDFSSSDLGSSFAEAEGYGPAGAPTTETVTYSAEAPTEQEKGFFQSALDWISDPLNLVLSAVSLLTGLAIAPAVQSLFGAAFVATPAGKIASSAISGAISNLVKTEALGAYVSLTGQDPKTLTQSQQQQLTNSYLAGGGDLVKSMTPGAVFGALGGAAGLTELPGFATSALGTFAGATGVGVLPTEYGGAGKSPSQAAQAAISPAFAAGVSRGLTDVLPPASGFLGRQAEQYATRTLGQEASRALGLGRPDLSGPVGGVSGGGFAARSAAGESESVSPQAGGGVSPAPSAAGMSPGSQALAQALQSGGGFGYAPGGPVMGSGEEERPRAPVWNIKSLRTPQADQTDTAQES